MMLLDLYMASHLSTLRVMLLLSSGIFIHNFDMVDHKTKNGMKKKMNLQVCDSGSRTIFVTLWESYAEKMSDFMSQNSDDVTTLQFGRFRAHVCFLFLPSR